ncbi:MAG: biopolymer transporter ExbD [Candidatus Pacebacteria bacterium]|nr:biopolymer transporter ExbD [Candidatus Paceibacterota bacterium]
MGKLLSSVQIETSESVDINLSPLIDMVFLLLIFFMVTTVFVEETGLTIDRPRAASSQQLEKNSVLLGVSADGRIMHGGHEISLNSVRGLVARLVEVRQIPVIVLADESADTGIVVRVIDQCKLAGAEQVSIAARED